MFKKYIWIKVLKKIPLFGHCFDYILFALKTIGTDCYAVSLIHKLNVNIKAKILEYLKIPFN